MKKGLLWGLIAVLLIVPFITVKAAANVEITKVELVEASDGVQINQEPTASGLNVNFDISFANVDDTAKYTVTVKNNDNEDYKISSKEQTSGEYMKYEFAFEDDSDVIKANSEKKMTITITYEHEVPADKLVEGKYEETNNVEVKLVNAVTNEEVVVENPKTGDNVLLYVNLLLVSMILCGVAIKTKKVRKGVALFALAVVALPLSAKALEEISIKLNTKVEISQDREFCFAYGENQQITYNYIVEDTWQDFIENYEGTELLPYGIDEEYVYYGYGHFPDGGEGTPIIKSNLGQDPSDFDQNPEDAIYFAPREYTECGDKAAAKVEEAMSSDELTEEERNAILEEYNDEMRVCSELNTYGSTYVKPGDKLMSKDKGCYYSFHEIEENNSVA